MTVQDLRSKILNFSHIHYQIHDFEINGYKNYISEAYLILFLRANLSVASSIEYLKNKLGIRIVFLSANKQSAFHWKILKEFK